jgi:hypothetical protein
MKKRRIANLIMVLAIVGILLSGMMIATMLTAEEESTFGSEYKITAIPDNRLMKEEDTQNLCTITIRCDTILNNTDKLEEAKAPYVPEDGVILPVITVEFMEGETVFDVLKRVCEASDLQIEYSWTPLYDSYYVEGINHLYEFDCGFESGWMYEVNDGFPNYGSSAYEVKPGDKIEWKYTCTGLGTDVGAERME